MSAVFAVRDGTVAQLLLSVHDHLDIPVLGCSEFGRGNLSIFEGSLLVQEVFCAQKRAQMLGAKRRVAVMLCRHCVEDDDEC